MAKNKSFKNFDGSGYGDGSGSGYGDGYAGEEEK